MNNIGLPTSQEDLDVIIAQHDPEGNGFISWDTFKLLFYTPKDLEDKTFRKSIDDIQRT